MLYLLVLMIPIHPSMKTDLVHAKISDTSRIHSNTSQYIPIHPNTSVTYKIHLQYIQFICKYIPNMENTSQIYRTDVLDVFRCISCEYIIKNANTCKIPVNTSQIHLSSSPRYSIMAKTPKMTNTWFFWMFLSCIDPPIHPACIETGQHVLIHPILPITWVIVMSLVLLLQYLWIHPIHQNTS